jgi:hypothetical protein
MNVGYTYVRMYRILKHEVHKVWAEEAPNMKQQEWPRDHYIASLPFGIFVLGNFSTLVGGNVTGGSCQWKYNILVYETN